jgi:hypothetical protein
MKTAANLPDPDPRLSWIDRARLWLANIISPKFNPPKSSHEPEKPKDFPANPDRMFMENDEHASPDLFSGPNIIPLRGFVDELDLPPGDRAVKRPSEKTTENAEVPAPLKPVPSLNRQAFDQAKADKNFKALQEHWSAILSRGLGEVGIDAPEYDLVVFDALMVALASLLTLHLPTSYVADLYSLMLEDLDADREIISGAQRKPFGSSYELGTLFALALKSADSQADLRGASHRTKIEAFHFGLIQYGAGHYSPEVLTRILEDLERAGR